MADHAGAYGAFWGARLVEEGALPRVDDGAEYVAAPAAGGHLVAGLGLDAEPFGGVVGLVLVPDSEAGLGDDADSESVEESDSDGKKKLFFKII